MGMEFVCLVFECFDFLVQKHMHGSECGWNQAWDGVAVRGGLRLGSCADTDAA